MLCSFVYLISGNSRTLTFSISGNSGLQQFPIFWLYVIILVSYLHLSLVTLSAVVSTSLSPDPQFPLFRATLHPDTPAALELSIACTRVLDYS